MLKLNDVKNSREILEFYKNELKLDEKELENRLQLVLEILPFLVQIFRLKGDCNLIHKTAKLDITPKIGLIKLSGKVDSTQEVESTFFSQVENLRSILKELKKKNEEIVVEL